MTHPLTHISKQWIARGISLGVVGPMAAKLSHSIVASDGAHQTTLLTGDSLAGGARALVTILGLVLVMGVAAGRLVDRREGFLNMAFVLGWVAWTSGRLGEVYRIAPGSDTLIKLSLETLVVGVAVLVAMMLMTNPKKGMGLGGDDEVSRFDLGYLLTTLAYRDGLIALLAAAGGALVIALLFGQTDLAGQSVGVGFGAGIAGGLIGALAGESVGTDDSKRNPIPIMAHLLSRSNLRSAMATGVQSGSSGRDDAQSRAVPFAPLMLGVVLAGVLAPLIGVLTPGSGSLLGLVFTGDLPGYLIVSPMAWTMGALLGVPIGHSWVEHSAAQASIAQAKPA